MGDRTEYAAGTFSWVDLSTPDQSAAKTFYSALFGWSTEDLPVGDGVVYTMARVDGKDVAAISPQREQQRAAGMPAVWNCYITVDDADAAAQRAGELGGTVHAPPFDVMSAGRMAVIQDPQGAFFSIWQAGEHIGAGLVNAPGALAWNELGSADIDGSKTFYGELFGWTFTPFEGNPVPYFVIRNGERGNGGITELAGPQPYWLPYLGCEDTAASLASAEKLGASAITGVLDIGIAEIAVVADPQGAVFALYAGDFED